LHTFLPVVLAVQKCLLQLVFHLHGFELTHRQLAMLRNTLDLVSLCVLVAHYLFSNICLTVHT
jgi:hypothetical protein